MKIVTLIPSYKPRPGIIERVIESVRRFSDKVVVFAAHELTYDGCEMVRLDTSIGHNLVFEPRKWILEHIDEDWDFVIYNEDDILLPETSVKTAIELLQSMRFPHVTGFNRFERYGGEKHWIDQHPDHGVHTNHPGTQYINKDDWFWIPSNFHSGNFILSKEYAKRLINDNKFDTRVNEFGVTYCGVLESGATSLYRHLIKVLPINFESVECEHLDNKYCFIQPTPTTQQLKDILS